MHLFQNVGGYDHQLVLAELVDEAPDLVLLIGIEAVGGLVQDQHLRIVDQGLSEAHTPPESLGERLDDLVDDGRERQAIDHHGEPLAPPLALQTAHVGDEVQEFCHRHLTVARRALGQIADAGFRGDGCRSISWPHTLTSPAVGEMKPAIMRMVVDLPAPFAPRKPSTSPGATVKLKSSTARISP